ncbi:MAG: DUF4397 domain-containing protein [Actinomycetota bacterium]
MKNSSAIRVAAAVALGLSPLAVASSAYGADDVTVTVVHGIPETNVDVYVNDKKTLPDFAFKTVTDPLSLPAGSYDIDIRKAGDPESAEPILTTDADLKAGQNVTVVANLTADGKPALNAFANPTTAVPSDMERVVVRHTAAAPAVDVLAGGDPIIEGLANPKEKSLMVPAGSVDVAVAPAGSTDPVLGPLTLDLKGGSTTVVYAIGSLEAENLTAVTQTYKSDHSTPTSVPAGEGSTDLGLILSITALGAGAIAFTASRTRTRRAADVRA